MSQVVVQNDTLVKVVGVLADEPVKVVGISTAELSINTRFPRGGTMYNAGGLSAPVNIIVWLKCDVAVTVTGIYALRRGGSGTTVNARRIRSGSPANFLASDLSLSSADTVFSSTTVQNADVIADDIIEIMLVTAAGGPTHVTIQIGMTA